MQGSQQQQAVMTNAGYVSQPYQTTSEVSSYASRQSTICGVLLVILGVLSTVFNAVDIAVGSEHIISTYIYSRHYYSSLSKMSNGLAAHGFWGGILVSILLFSSNLRM